MVSNAVDITTDERVSEVYGETYSFARHALKLDLAHAACVADTAVREYIEQVEEKEE